MDIGPGFREEGSMQRKKSGSARVDLTLALALLRDHITEALCSASKRFSSESAVRSGGVESSAKQGPIESLLSMSPEVEN